MYIAIWFFSPTSSTSPGHRGRIYVNDHHGSCGGPLSHVIINASNSMKKKKQSLVDSWPG